MNYLAHLYLSGDSVPLRIGNFIGDHLRGSEGSDLPELVKKGVLMHRAIDTYTDTHEKVLESIRRLRPRFRKYSGVIVDMYYDHFLAANWADYSDVPLEAYTDQVYKELEENIELLPLSAQRMLPYMVDSNWLMNYASIEGIHKALSGISRRTKFKSHMEYASTALEEDYTLYEAEFKLFFAELQQFSETFIREN